MSSKPFGLAVRAVVCDPSGRCLLLRRSAASEHYAGCWEWPGGKVDPGEDFALAVVRETREEIGLEVEIMGFAGATEFELPKVHVVFLCMEARIVGGTPLLSPEHDAFDWVPLSELGNRQLVGHVESFMTAYAARSAEGEGERVTRAGAFCLSVDGSPS
jgi:8-oxo-dGTP diphosphatase